MSQRPISRTLLGLAVASLLLSALNEGGRRGLVSDLFVRSSSVQDLSVGLADVVQSSAVYEYGDGTYAWVLPPVGYSDEDYPRGVRFPILPSSGFAGIAYPIFGANPSGSGDGRAWDPTGTTPAITNAIPAFNVEKGTEVALNLYFTSPGKTTTVTAGGFSSGSIVTGTGAGLTAWNATADSDGVVEMNVTLSDTATIGQSYTLTLTSGATTKQATLVAADPYKAHDWSASRAVSKANLGIAAWIATHADDYSAAGVRISTLNNEADPVTTSAMAAITQGSDRASVEGAAAQLAIWQVLVGKNVISGTPEANSPIAEYQAANPHSTSAQGRNSGGTFQVLPLQTSLDTAVVDRAIELFVAATGDGVIGGGDDKTESEPWHTPVVTLSVDAASATVTVTGTRTSAAGTSEPLAGASVTLTGADFDPTTAGVQNKTVTLGSSGTGTSPIVLTGSAQAITATGSVTIPAGALLSTAPRGSNPSTMQLAQMLTAKAASVSLSASGAAPPASASPTTTPVVTIPGPNGVGVVLDGALTFSPSSTVAPGGTLQASGTGLASGSARLALVSSSNPAGVVLRDATVGVDGVLSVAATIPANTTPGTYYIRAIDAAVKVYGGEITVSGTPVTTSPGTTTPGTTTPGGPTPTTTSPTSATTTPASTLPGPNGVGVKLDGPLTFSSPTVAPGGTVKVNGTGLAAGSARLALVSSANPAGVVIGDITVGADGVLSGDATIPADTTAGAYYIRAIDASVKIFGGEITVSGSPVTTSPSPTTAPCTPSQTMPVGPPSTLPGPNGVGVKLDGTLTFAPVGTVAPGATISVSGTGLAAGSARFALVSSCNPAGVVLSDAVVPSTGTLFATITIPANTPNGVYFIRAIDASVKVYGVAVLVSTPAAVPTTTRAVTSTAPATNRVPIAQPRLDNGKAGAVTDGGTVNTVPVAADTQRVKIGTESVWFAMAVGNTVVAVGDGHTLQAAGVVTFSGAGFKPGSTVEIWLFSTPTLVGTATAGADGTFAQSMTIPAALVGSHTLQAEGVGTDGKDVALAYGVTVAAPKLETPDSLPFTGPAVSLALLIFAIACGSASVYLRRRTLEF